MHYFWKRDIFKVFSAQFILFVEINVRTHEKISAQRDNFMIFF